jgi:DNA processing protein
MSDELLKYQIGITLIPGIGSINAKKLIAYTGGPEAVFREKKQHLLKIPGIGDVLADCIAKANVLPQAEKEIEFIKKYQIRYSYFLDADYPHRLKNCEDSPVIMFYKGVVDFNVPKILSVVGTRNATEYGRTCCEKFIEELCARNHEVLIVSGLAYGIDICAHRAALKNGLNTVAVLGHGLGTLYPAAHKPVAKEIITHGALVSDFVSHIMPDRNSFVRRNRIVAGMADATLVVESGIKGGALITADLASSYNRDVFAFPGRAGDSHSQGCNWLIKSNKAALVESVTDLEYQLGWEPRSKDETPRQASLFVEISEEEKALLNAFNAEKELPIDIICIRTDFPMSKVSALLLSMEFAGLVKSLPGKMYRKLV